MNQYQSETDRPISRETFYTHAQSIFLRNNHEQLKTMIQLMTERYHFISNDYDINEVIEKVAFGVVHEFFCTEISGSIISVHELCRKHILYILL